MGLNFVDKIRPDFCNIISPISAQEAGPQVPDCLAAPQPAEQSRGMPSSRGPDPCPWLLHQTHPSGGDMVEDGEILNNIPYSRRQPPRQRNRSESPVRKMKPARPPSVPAQSQSPPRKYDIHKYSQINSCSMRDSFN